MDAPQSTTCPYCGDVMSNPRRVQCGKPECKRAYRNERARRWNAEHPGYRAKYPRNNDVYEHVCEVCGVVFKSHKQEQRTCSVECHSERCRRRRMQLIPHPGPFSVLPAKHPAVLMQQPEYKRLFVAGRCRRCGEYFVAHSEAGIASYCSRSCQSLDSKDRRRALKRGVGHIRYNRAAIFERDAWRCHLCGRKVRRDVSTHHALAPTIDHLVPLSCGGADAPDNVACAHRRCNTVKNARGQSQLLLMG